MKIPCITGEWRVLFKPEVHGNYVNDHSIVKGSDGLWHIYGITSFEGTPGAERYFAHGKGESLEDFLKNKAFSNAECITVNPENQEKEAFENYLSRYSAAFDSERAALKVK